MKRKLYKAFDELGADVDSAFPWPLPKDGRPGEWVEVQADLIGGFSGLHLSTLLDLPRRLGAAIYEAEGDGECIAGQDELLFRRARLLRRTAWDAHRAVLFAADCAERALWRERALSRELDLLSWTVIFFARHVPADAGRRPGLLQAACGLSSACRERLKADNTPPPGTACASLAAFYVSKAAHAFLLAKENPGEVQISAPCWANNASQTALEAAYRAAPPPEAGAIVEAERRWQARRLRWYL